ncbi:MAG: hypothetical protein Q7T48_19145 [Cellvibrio sp.]|nr:hypothetical protein [Cellvibrio sp.]
MATIAGTLLSNAETGKTTAVKNKQKNITTARNRKNAATKSRKT